MVLWFYQYCKFIIAPRPTLRGIFVIAARKMSIQNSKRQIRDKMSLLRSLFFNDNFCTLKVLTGMFRYYYAYNSIRTHRISYEFMSIYYIQLLFLESDGQIV